MLSIFHTADLHIQNNRRDILFNAFNQLIEYIKNDRSMIKVLVIAGDIFHNKIKLTAEDVNDFKNIIELCSIYVSNVIITLGNHDCNLNNQSQLDLLTPLIELYKKSTINKNTALHYLKKSGLYTICGVDFVVISPLYEIPFTNSPDFIKENKILIFHELIDGFQHNQNRYKGRLTLDYLKDYELALGGHIHDFNIIDDKIAYSGSLIQQTFGETINKGFIHWYKKINLLSCEPLPNCKFKYKFIEINQPVLLKIIISNNETQYNGILNESAKIDKSIIEVKDNNSAENLTKICADLKRYKSEPEIYNYSEKNTSEKLNELIDIQTQNDLIVEFLKNNNITNENICNKILNIHNQLTENIYHKPYKWTLLYLEFEGLYCYPSKNVIDFTTLKNKLSGLIAPNKTGKSAIVDILVFALFNKILRGDARSIINNMSKKYNIKIAWSIEDNIHTLTRGRTSDNVNHILYEINDKNETEENIEKTYKKIEEYIGTFYNFLSIILTTQNKQNDFLNMTNTQQKELLSKLLGLDILEDILKKISEKININKGKIKLLKNTVKNNNVQELKNQLNENSQLLNELNSNYKEIDANINNTKISRNLNANNEFKEINKKYLALFKNTDSKHKNKEYYLKLSKSDIEKNIDMLKLSYVDLTCGDEKLAKNSEISEKHTNIEAENDISQKLEQLRRMAVIAKKKNKLTAIRRIPPKYYIFKPEQNDKIGLYLERMGKIQAKFSADDKKTYNDIYNSFNEYYEQYIKLLSVHNEQYNKYKYLIDKYNKYKDVDNITNRESCIIIRNTYTYSKMYYEYGLKYEKILKDIPIKEDLNKTIFKIKIDPEIIKNEEQYNIHTLLKLKYNGDCLACIHNKKIKDQVRVYNINKFTLCENETGLEDYKKQNQINRDIISHIETNITQYIIKKTQIVNIDHPKVQALVIKKYDKYIDFYRNLYEHFDEINDILQQKKKLDEINIELTPKKYQTYYIKIKLHKYIQKYGLDEIKKDYNIKTINDEINYYTTIQNNLEQYNKNVKILKRIDKENNKLKIVNLINSRQLLKQQVKLEELCQNRANLIERINGAKDKIKDITADIKNAELFDKINNKIEIYEIYRKSLSYKTGLPCIILKQTAGLLEAEINKILQRMTDFKLEFNFKYTGKTLSLDMRIKSKELSIPIAMGSGYQQFVSSLAFRRVLSKICQYPLPNFIIIDEGFGVLDDINLEKVSEYMKEIPTIYDFVFIITHIDKLQNILDMPFYIKTDGTSSYLHDEFSYIDSRNSASNLLIADQLNNNQSDNNQLNETNDIICEKDNKYYCNICKKLFLKRLSSMNRHLASKKHLDKINKLKEIK